VVPHYLLNSRPFVCMCRACLCSHLQNDRWRWKRREAELLALCEQREIDAARTAYRERMHVQHVHSPPVARFVSPARTAQSTRREWRRTRHMACSCATSSVACCACACCVSLCTRRAMCCMRGGWRRRCTLRVFARDAVRAMFVLGGARSPLLHVRACGRTPSVRACERAHIHIYSY
jgi:hypothetical protein